MKQQIDHTTFNSRKYRRRWIGICIIFLTFGWLFYVTQIPTPFHATPKTTGLANPTLSEGKVDYFAAAYEKLYKDDVEPPEDNGLRTLLIAYGPRIFGYVNLEDEIPWSQFDSNSYTQVYFHQIWVPLCQGLQIDPYAEPPYWNNLSFYEFYNKLENAYWKTSGEASLPFLLIDDPDFHGLRSYEFLTKWLEIPREVNRSPQIAQWLQERSPVLDLFNESVRKPNFINPWIRSEYNEKYHTLLFGASPFLWRFDLGLERLVQDLQIRISDHVAKKIRNENAHAEIDKAWYDAMSLFYLARKSSYYNSGAKNNDFEKTGFNAVFQIIRYGNPTPEQLERFAKELDSLPEVLFPKNVQLEKYLIMDIALSSNSNITTTSNWGIVQHLDSLIHELPVDRTIIGKRVLYHFEQSGFDQFSQSRFEKDNYHDLKAQIQKIHDYWDLNLHPKLDSATAFSQLTIQTRSRRTADYHFLSLFYSLKNKGVDSFFERIVRMDILRTAIALERFQRQNGEYPETLQELVPQFLAKIPVDPFAETTAPIQYERDYVAAHGQEYQYRLFSYGFVEYIVQSK